MKFSLDHSTPTQETTKKVLTEKWNEVYACIPLIEVINALTGDTVHLAEERRKFIIGERVNPVLTYPNIDAEHLAFLEGELLTLKAKIIADDATAVTDSAHALAKAYRWRLNERIAEVRMLQATAAGNMYAFDTYTRFIYGAPSLETFNYTLSEVREKFLPYVHDAREEVLHAVQRFLALLPQQSGPVYLRLPSAELIRQVHESTLQHLGHLIDPSLVKGQKHDAEGIKHAFEYALVQGGLHGWKVVIVPNRTAINTNQERKVVEIPEKRVVTTQKLKELIVHEIGTHAARRFAGESTGIELLATGLDRYVAGEEGVATFHEQGIRGTMEEYAGMERYLCIGLAQGLDGVLRDFRDTYIVIYAYHLAKEMVTEKSSLDEARAKASSRAWRAVLRAFRGTDAKTPGVVYTKDISYRDGNIGIWQRIVDNPEELMRISSGKYDPSNERHRFILDNLHIHEDEFEKLLTDA